MSQKYIAYFAAGALGLGYLMIPQNILTKLIFGGVGLGFSAAAVEGIRRERSEVAIKNLGVVFKEVALGQVPITPASIVIPVTLQDADAFLKGKLDLKDLTTPNFWTLDRAKRSRIMLGQGSSGKSFLQAFLCQILVHGGVHLKIGDPHYDSVFREGRQKTDWLPGMPETELRERYLITDIGAIHDYLIEFAEEAHRRLDGKVANPIPMYYCMDEWNKFIRQWGEARIKSALEALHFLADEGDKADMHFGVTLHSLTEKNSRLDASIRMFCDHYLMGASLANSSNTFPDGFKPSELLRRVKETYTKGGIKHQRVMGFWSPDMDYTDGAVVVAPALPTTVAFEPEKPAPEKWLERNRPEIERLIRTDFNRFRFVSNVADELKAGSRSNNNPIYVALRDAHTEILEAIKREQEAEASPEDAPDNGHPENGASDHDLVVSMF